MADVVLPLTPNPQMKEDFTKGPDIPKQMTKEEADKLRKDTEAMYDDRLPYMRKEDEYNKLVISSYEQDVLLGRIPIKEVPGLLGLEMMTREIQARGYLMQWQMGQEEAKKRHEQEQQMLKEKEEFDKMSPEDQAKVLKEMEDKLQKEQENTPGNKRPQ